MSTVHRNLRLYYKKNINYRRFHIKIIICDEFYYSGKQIDVGIGMVYLLINLLTQSYIFFVSLFIVIVVHKSLNRCVRKKIRLKFYITFYFSKITFGRVGDSIIFLVSTNLSSHLFYLQLYFYSYIYNFFISYCIKRMIHEKCFKNFETFSKPVNVVIRVLVYQTYSKF